MLNHSRHWFNILNPSSYRLDYTVVCFIMNKVMKTVLVRAERERERERERENFICHKTTQTQ